MGARRIVALCGAAMTAGVLIASAGAGTNRAAAPAVDVSSRTSIVKYLRSIGVDPAGVVIQRGTRNYAGPSCPGKGWRCTHATRVVQVAQRSGWNQFECSGTSDEETGSCLVVQESPDGNTARCTMATDGNNPITQTCTITQTSVEGDNRAFVDQTIKQHEDSDQEGTQNASVTQTSDSGNNDSHVRQKIEQNTKDRSLDVAQSQRGRQRASVVQTSITGDQDSHLKQKSSQDANAPKAMSGTQDLNADLFATVDQHSAGLSRNHNRQNESQDASAGKDSSVSQTLVGPIYCCSDQGTNPDDHFDVDQTATQQSSSDSAALSENVRIFCTTTGTCDGREVVNENGNRTTNECSSPTCSIGVNCVENECTPCEGEGCFSECVECGRLGPAFRSFVGVFARRRA